MPPKAAVAPTKANSVIIEERKIPWRHEPGAAEKAEFDRLRGITNLIKTTKYTKLNFLPKGLREQFQKQANFYFLVMIILMLIGTHTNLWIGTIAAWSTAAMLGGMISVSLAVSWYDDQRRATSDKLVNERSARIRDGLSMNQQQDPARQKTSPSAQWADIKVGDLVVLQDGEEIPADIVVLSATGRSGDGTCYVSTANLDGETSLKLKHSVLGAKLVDKKGDIWVEPPQKNLYSFSGRFVVDEDGPKPQKDKENGHVYPLSIDHVMLRGCVVRNTDEIMGLVIYTGVETRIMMNSKSNPGKLSNLEHAINMSMWVAVATQGFMALAVDIVYNTSEKSVFRNLEYLYPQGYSAPSGALPDLLAYLIMFFVLYSNLVPVSLYATMEVCNTAYAFFIAHDPEMDYYMEAGGDQREHVPAVARATNLCHELGQVSYIFSDKTGTLTKNIMTLQNVAVGPKPGGGNDICGVSPLESEKNTGTNPSPKNAPARPVLRNTVSLDMAKMRAKQREDSFFGERRAAPVFEVLAVCHTGMWNPVGHKLEFESPDEQALVKGAADSGMHFWRNSDNTTELRKGNLRQVQAAQQGAKPCEKVMYKILAVNKFTSARKRMSVVVEKGGEQLLLIKGADNVMASCVTGGLSPELIQQLTDFSKKGLRTLVIGRRDLSKFDVAGWLEKFKIAEQMTRGREAKLTELAAEIETEVTVDGCTAIEDELQDDVGETITNIRKAGIKLWVLTGDKLETAISIGYSTKVLQPHGMDILAITTDAERKAAEDDRDSTVQFMDVEQATVIIKDKKNTKKKALVITGDKMVDVTGNVKTSKEFIDMAKDCDVLILARSSPLQKAEMVELVRENVKVEGVLPKPVTLAIGDGANDVPMIMASQVGVGIFGREGRQAANSADFAIGQFKFLQNLLLVHGRWNYRRACKFTLFTFWRNAVQVLLMCYYTPLSGYSGTTLFEDNLRITFNFLCTIPIIATGLFDRDVSEEKSLANPEFYEIGRRGFDLSPMAMLQTMWSAFMHSIIILSVAICAYPDFDMNQSGDYWTIGCFIYTLLVHAVAVRVAFLTSTWNIWSVVFMSASYVFYAMFLGVYNIASGVIKPGFHGVIGHMLTVEVFWTCMLVVPLFQIAWDLLAWQTYNVATRKFHHTAQSTIMWHLDMMNEMPCKHKEQKIEVGPRSLRLQLDLFLKQQLPSYQIVRRFDRMSAMTFAAFLILAALSYANHADSKTVTFVEVQYHTGDWPNAQDDLPTSDKAFVIHNLSDCSVQSHQTQCNLRIPESMGSPVSVYYNIGPFYENYLDFVKTTDYAANSFATRIANRTFFNDTFEIQDVVIKQENIAWPTDLAFVGELEPEVTALFNTSDIAKEHMAVWMRPAALPQVSKLYGIIDTNLANRTITINIHNRYPAGNSTKRLYLTDWKGGAGNLWAELLLWGSGLALLVTALLGFIAYLRTMLPKPKINEDGTANWVEVDTYIQERVRNADSKREHLLA